jgi:nucleoside-diphosphate-sugar epimerase
VIAYVTGAPGWLGTRLVECLIRGLPEAGLPAAAERVRCFVREGIDTSALEAFGPGVEIRRGDLRNAQEVQRFVEGASAATLFHCAGVIHPSRGVKELYQVNVQGTRSLLAAAEAAGARRFIYMSSNSPAGCNKTPGDSFDEQAPYQPYMHYGRSKMQAELAVKEAGARGRLQTVIVRSPWFYGPGQPERQTLFFRMIRGGKFPLVGSGENRRSMAYIDNICQGLILCAQVERAAGQTYWIADREPYSMNQILGTVEDVMEKELKVTPARRRVRLPWLAGEVATWADAALQSVGLYQQKIHVLSEMNKTIACSIAKAERELGFQPKVALAEGMRRSLEWMRSRGMSF